ncbi:MAG: hypothetical protein ACRD32_00450 [Nitrososphaerales archaeon]
MRVTELLYEMAHLQPAQTGLMLPIYVGPDEVYGTQLPHNVPRIKISTRFSEIPITIPQSDEEIPDIPKSIFQRKTYRKKIPRGAFIQIQHYVKIHRKALTDFYFGKITEFQLKQLLGLPQN